MLKLLKLKFIINSSKEINKLAKRFKGILEGQSANYYLGFREIDIKLLDNITNGNNMLLILIKRIILYNFKDNQTKSISKKIQL